MYSSTNKYRKTKKGVVTNIYHHLKSRNTVEFSLSFLHSFSECKKFDRLFVEWEKSSYDKQFKPTIDRINNKKGYLKNNIQWLSWADNRYKQTMERRSRKGSVHQIMGKEIVATFKSQREAVMKTGISQSNMSSVLNGKRKTCAGYKFTYANPELLK